MMKKISFIVPVYNGEKVLQRAVDSILWQTGVDFELIIIDDGSRDGTAALCDDIASRDGRVRVFHTENQGQGLARNFGIDRAEGRYLFFCDADDYVEWDGLMALLETAEQEDCDVTCGLYHRIQDGVSERIGEKLASGIVSRNGTADAQKLFHRIKTESLFGYVWNKLYRRGFLQENNLRFNDIRQVYMEDTLFNLKVFAKTPRYYLKNVSVYTYIAEGTSTTRKAEPDIAEKNARLLAAYDSFLKAEGSREENLDLFVPLAMRTLSWSLFKNLPYEGIHFQKLRERVQVFLDTPAFACVLAERKNIYQLWKIPSMAQRLFFSYCFLTVGIAGGSLLSSTFVLGYPLMKWYARSTVK